MPRTKLIKTPRKETVVPLALPDSQTHYKALVMRALWNHHQDRQIGHVKEQRLETNPWHMETLHTTGEALKK